MEMHVKNECNNFEVLILRKTLNLKSISFIASHVEKSCFAVPTKDVQKHQNQLFLHACL